MEKLLIKRKIALLYEDLIDGIISYSQYVAAVAREKQKLQQLEE